MNPGVFSLENAMEILQDDERRRLSAEARSYAEVGAPPREDFGPEGTIWEHVVSEHRRIFWRDAYFKRKARIKRMAASRSDIEGIHGR